MPGCFLKLCLALLVCFGLRGCLSLLLSFGLRVACGVAVFALAPRVRGTNFAGDCNSQCRGGGFKGPDNESVMGDVPLV